MQHRRAVDTIGLMLANGTITAEMHDAAVVFRTRFRAAALDDLQPMAWDRVPGGTGDGMTEPFDETIHAPNRLRICAFLDATTSTEFSVLRDLLGVADSVLSKHLRVLQDGGYVEMTKPTGRGRVRTWVSLTPAGRRAYRSHVAALRALFDAPVPDRHRAEQAGAPPTP